MSEAAKALKDFNQSVEKLDGALKYEKSLSTNMKTAKGVLNVYKKLPKAMQKSQTKNVKVNAAMKGLGRTFDGSFKLG